MSNSTGSATRPTPATPTAVRVGEPRVSNQSTPSRASHSSKPLTEHRKEIIDPRVKQEMAEFETDVSVVRTVFTGEQERFARLVRRGRPLVSRYRSRGPLTERDLFELHDTHGLPRELVLGLLSEPSSPEGSGRNGPGGQGFGRE